MITALIISIFLNIILIKNARDYATKSIDKHRETIAKLRIICEYIDLFIIKDNKVEKNYRPLDWKRLENFKTVIKRGLEYNSIVDLHFKELNDEGYYELNQEQRKKLYMQSANTKVFTDEEIHTFCEALIAEVKNLKTPKTQ